MGPNRGSLWSVWRASGRRDESGNQTVMEGHRLKVMISIKRILCPTDLSPHSSDAVRYALALSRAHEAELILLHCTNDADGEDKLAASVMDHIGPSDSRWH